MAHRVAIADQDYAALADASPRTGTSIVEFVHQAIMARRARCQMFAGLEESASTSITMTTRHHIFMPAPPVVRWR